MKFRNKKTFQYVIPAYTGPFLAPVMTTCRLVRAYERFGGTNCIVSPLGKRQISSYKILLAHETPIDKIS
jgi:hypothetical protein